MAIIPPADARKIGELLANELSKDVHITLLNRPGGLVLPDRVQPPYDKVADLMAELAVLSPYIQLAKIDVRKSPERLQEFNVDKVPVIVFEHESLRNIRFFGFPGGFGFSNVLQTIIQVSKGETGLAEEFIKEVNALPGALHLQVFVTPTSAQCSLMAGLAISMALATERVTTDVIEATEFVELTKSYNVTDVPATVINDAAMVVGAMRAGELMEQLRQIFSDGGGGTSPGGAPQMQG